MAANQLVLCCPGSLMQETHTWVPVEKTLQYAVALRFPFTGDPKPVPAYQYFCSQSQIHENIILQGWRIECPAQSPDLRLV